MQLALYNIVSCFNFLVPINLVSCTFMRESGAVQFEVHVRRVRSAAKNLSGFGDNFLTSSENASTYGVPLVWAKLPDLPRSIMLARHFI
jgi:hypothetical protein